ncbi:MAG TPA: ABC transporter substrate-binding protein [Sphingobium sp.]|nr:ABC transporter substrate-binding protein [Sphingobium sp.]
MIWRTPANRSLRRLIFTGLLLAAASCTTGQDDSPVKVDLIGMKSDLLEPLRASDTPAGKATLGAIAQGLLSFDARGEVMDALAESWIVEAGGQSYIFRLKRISWADGDEPVKAETVARLLRERFRANPTWLAGLKPQVRAMTDRVIEIRLDAALPAFLQLLAQPQFAIMAGKKGTGPYRAKLEGNRLDLTPVTGLGNGALENTQEEPATARHRIMQADSGARALVRFAARRTDLVLGGRFQHLLLVPAAGFAMTDLRIDPVSGLFGLAITSRSPLLADGNVRDALARVIDRAALATALGLPGWQTLDHPLPAALELDRPPTMPVWAESDRATRVAIARQAVEHWRSRHDEPPPLRVALPQGAGATLLFRRLTRDFAELGIRITRVAADAPADLVLIDEVAPFDSALWYLSRLDCAAGLRCDARASDLLAAAREADTAAEQARLLGEAERLIVGYSAYIPLGQPIRWSLASRRLTGFEPSPRGVHPLNKLIPIPN